MPVYNGVKTIERSISSLSKQTFSNFELLVVDDGSNDGSLDLLLHWNYQDHRVRVLQTRHNLGPAAARNLAAQHACGDMITYLDCDDEYYPDYLEQVVRLSQQAQILIFGYDYCVEGDKSSSIRFWEPTQHSHTFFERNLTTPLGLAHHRSLLNQVGGFNELLWCQEDWDYWKRLVRTGARVRFVPQRSGLYRFRQGSRSLAPKATSRQLAAYQASWAKGASLYGDPLPPLRRHPVQKVLFAAPHSYFQWSDPVAATASGILQSLTLSGFTCQAFCGLGFAPDESQSIEPTLRGLGLPFQVRDCLHGPYSSRLFLTREGNVPITLVLPNSTTTDGDQVPAIEPFLAFFEKYLETYQPDVLLTHSANPYFDPIIRLAKRRDIPIVVPLLDVPQGDRVRFYYVDYCLVQSEELRKQYWNDWGLACIALPPITNLEQAQPAYAEFFSKVHPQPGPPFMPQSFRELNHPNQIALTRPQET